MVQKIEQPAQECNLAKVAITVFGRYKSLEFISTFAESEDDARFLMKYLGKLGLAKRCKIKPCRDGTFLVSVKIKSPQHKQPTERSKAMTDERISQLRDMQEMMDVGKMLANLPETLQYLVYGLILGANSATNTDEAKQEMSASA